jgi:hypothetical protein
MKPRMKIAYNIAAGIWICTGAFAADADQVTVVPPEDSMLLLEVVVDGVQIYTCEAKDGGFAWSFKAPEATFFDKRGRQVGTHFAGPTWKMDDGCVVVGEVRSSQGGMRQNQAQFNGCCYAPKALRVRVLCRPLLISAGLKPGAE